MKPYIITYSEGGETSQSQWSGFNADHAIERFMDTMSEEGGSEGVRVLSARCASIPARKR